MKKIKEKTLNPNTAIKKSSSKTSKSQTSLTEGKTSSTLQSKRVANRSHQSETEVAGAIASRKDMEMALQESEEAFRTLAESVPHIVWATRADGWNIFFNKRWVEYTGLTLEESYGHGWNIPFHPDDKKRAWDAWQQATKHGATYSLEVRLRRADGIYRWWLVRGAPLLDTTGKIIKWFGTCTDIDDLKQAERRQSLLSEILGILNNPSSMDDAISKIITALKRETGFDAIGIRLQRGDDFPYFAQDGFSKEFILAENTLAVRTQDGDVCVDKDGNVCLECTCGTVISGKTDPSNPIFTPRGSCWTNESCARPDHSIEDKRLHPRDGCIHEGYHSVALIPLRADERIIGILQLNDHRPNQFTLEMISFLEDMGALIGIAVARKRAEDEMHKAKERADALNLELEAANKELEDRVAARTADLSRINEQLTQEVGERRRAEEAERASRTKLAAAFASMTEAIFIADAGGRLTDFNDEFVRYHRFKDRDECSRTIDDCPKYLEVYFADGTPAPVEEWAMARALRGEMESNVEYRLRRKETGETWWGSYSFAPIKDKDGGIAGAIVSAREITALKQADAALRASEERLRYHVENSPLAVVEWDTEFIVTRWAGEAEKIFGWSAAETVGKHIMDLRMIFEEDIPIVQKTIKKLTNGNARHVVSTNRNYTKDGRVIHCMWYNTVLQDATGKMKSVMSQGLDITERKKAEDEIVRRSAILAGINTVFNEALTCATDEELSEVCLKMAEEITASKMGFIGEIGPDGLLHDIAISNPGWEACTMYDKKGFRRSPGNFHIHGIYGRVLLNGKSFYTNDPFTHPDSIGIPEGHPPLTAFLGVPLKHGGKTIGMIGVGNRQGGYREKDMETLEAVAPSIVETLMRKRAEESLANAKSTLEQERDILQSVMDGAKNSHLVYLDRDFNFVRVNETYAQTCGYRPEQMIGKNHFALYPHAENEAIFARVRDSGEPVVFHDKPFEFPDQPERGVTYWDWTLTPVKNPSGQVSGLVFSLFETTERKQAERRQALLAKILSILNDPPTLDNAINLILSAIKQETGLAAVGLRLHCGDDFPYFAHDGFSEEFVRAENALTARNKNGGVCTDNNGNISLECTCGLVISGRTDPSNPLFTPKGSFWTNESFGLLDIPADEDPRHRPRNRCIHEGFHSVALIPMRTGNQIIGMLQLNDNRPNQFTPEMISFFEDLGDVIGIALSRKQAADDMKRAKELSDALNLELEVANKELDAFSYSVSHDLRAPLRHMAGFAELLKKRLEGQADEKANKYLETISEASKKMEVLINDLLSFSHIGRADIRKRKIDFNALVRGIVREIHEEVPERDISWDIDELPEVLGDQSLLRLAIVNLVSNAVKYTATRSLAEIKIGCKDEGDEFVFCVKDNGVGFDIKYVDRLFGVFQRLHSNDEFEGTGIGLANVQRIISRHGGRVWAEGVVEKGATFYFTLPKLKVK